MTVARVRAVAALVVAAGLAGAASAGFLASLDAITELRGRHGWLLWLLPLAGAVAVAAGVSFGDDVRQGNRLTMRRIHDGAGDVPVVMAPVVYLGTLATHLFGGSAGREGTALQMSAALTDTVARRLTVTPEHRRVLLVASLAGGFGSVFGVPWAGVVFAVEVAPAGWRAKLAALPACVVASVLADRVVAWIGVEHHAWRAIEGIDGSDVLRVAVLAPAFGVVAWGFVRVCEAVKDGATRLGPPAVRGAVGGAVVVAVTLAIGNRDYNGLSVPLLVDAVGGRDVADVAWLLKLVLTAATIGVGFAGGEVTPLFVVGGTLGSVLAGLVDAPRGLVAAVGMVATFGAAANAPVAAAVMAVELFGWGVALPAAVGCGIARCCSSRRSIYHHGATDDVPVEAELI